MKLAVITDEISDEFEHVLDVCQELGIRALELRTIGGRQIVDHCAEELEAIHAAVRNGGFSVCAIAAPYLKSERGIQGQELVLAHALRAARFLSARFVRAFSYWRESDPSSVLAPLGQTLRDAVAAADTAETELLLENEHECNVGSVAELMAALDAVVDPRLGVIWDPANAAMLAPEGPHDISAFPGLLGRVHHVHVKDADASGNWVQIGQGVVDHAALLRTLEASNYTGHISIETHYERNGSKEAATRECVASLRAIARTAGVTLH